VTVITAFGAVSPASDFAIVPTLTSMTPDGGPVGTAVTITGTGFAGVTQLRFSGSSGWVSSAFTKTGATKIDTTVPDGALPGDILLSVPSTLTAPAVGVRTDDFHVVLLGDPSPTLALAGDELTLAGFSLGGASSVKFGGGAIATPNLNSGDQRLYVTVPVGAQTGKITVTTPYGNVSTPTKLLIEGITSFSPTSGGGGTVVTINGTGFLEDPANPVQNVAVGGAFVSSYTVNSNTKITATLPAYGFSTGNVSIFTGLGAYTPWSLTFTVPTAIVSFEPTSGPVGTLVHVHGTGLLYNVDGVGFNGLGAGWGADSVLQEAYGWVPVGATSGPISVHTYSNGWVTSAQSFTVTS
jgi:hypothetical protein